MKIGVFVICGSILILLGTGCGTHRSEPFGFRNAGDVRKVEADTSLDGRYREAIRAGSLTTIEALISEGAVVNFKWPDGRTPLIEAVISNQLEVVEWLLQKGADSNEKDAEGLTAIDHASDRPAILRLLVPPDSGESEELISAVQEDRVEDLRDLLDSGADPNTRSTDGETLLTLAIKGGSDGIIKTLLQDERTNVDQKNKAGESPLSLARQGGLARAERMLLQRGASE